MDSKRGRLFRKAIWKKRQEKQALERIIQSEQIEHQAALFQIKRLTERLKAAESSITAMAAEIEELVKKPASQDGAMSMEERELLAANQYHQMRIRGLEEYVRKLQESQKGVPAGGNGVN